MARQSFDMNLWRLPLVFSGAAILFAQSPLERYGPLVHALNLTDAQIKQLAETQGEGPRPALLDARRQLGVREIAKENVGKPRQGR